MKPHDYLSLPGLIRRKEFQRLTGLSNRDMRAAIENGEIRIWRRPVRVYLRNGRRYRPRVSHALYFKADLLRYSPLEE